MTVPEHPGPSQAPSCVLALLQTSATMGHKVGTAAMSKLDAARTWLDFVLDAIVRAESRGAWTGPGPAVAVVGYDTSEGGEPRYRSLLPGTTQEQFWVTAATLASHKAPRRSRGPRRWIEVAPSTTGSRTGAALELGHRLVRDRLTTSPTGGPPLLLHCGDGHSDDDPPGHLAGSLHALTTPGGSLKLIHCLFHEERGPSVGDRPTGAEWDAIWDSSSVLDGSSGARALAINTWPRRTFQGFLVPRGPRRGPFTGPPPSLATYSLRLQKGGNRPDQWEDAMCADEAQGLAAICDGASEGVFVKTWAAILARRFGSDRPNLDDPRAWATWLDECRQEWLTTIRYPDGVNYVQKRKVQEVGGAATFVGLKLTTCPADEGDDGATVGWRAWCVGDSCLFLVRDNRLRMSFPAVASRDFGRAPALLRTLNRNAGMAPLTAAGRCRPGDTFILATDAIAEWLFRELESGFPVDWERFWSLDATIWEAEIEALRAQRRIVDDDCTMLLIRVGAEVSADDVGERSVGVTTS